MPSVIKSVSFDAADALALARFWAAVFGSDVDEDSTTDKAFVEAAGWGGPNIWFTRVPEPKAAKNRMHFDLRAPATVAAEVSRCRGAGCHRGPQLSPAHCDARPRGQRVLRRTWPRSIASRYPQVSYVQSAADEDGYRKRGEAQISGSADRPFPAEPGWLSLQTPPLRSFQRFGD